MVNEPKKSTRAIRIFALSFVSCLALAAASASGASATSLEAESPAELPLGFTVLSGGISAESGGGTVFCKSQTEGYGKLQGEATGVATLEFHGCVMFAGGTWTSCTSSGAESGRIVTTPLAIDLVKLKKENPEESYYPPGIALAPLSQQEVVATFTCAAGFVHGEWAGELIGAIEEPSLGGVAISYLTADFSSGAQTYDGRETSLLYSSDNGATFNKVTLSASSFDLEYGGGAKVRLSLEEGNQHPAIVVAGGFPAAVSVVPLPYEGFNAVLRQSGGGRTITCKGTSAVSAVTGSGEFDNPNSGHFVFTLHNCKESSIGSNCTSSGQSPGTVVTESLPMRLTYLSDGKPGIAFEENKSSGKVAQMTCAGGLLGIKVTGGVLGRVSSPAFGKSFSELSLKVGAVKQGEEYVQEYTKTAGGEAVSLFETTNGGSAKSASLELPGPLLTFGHQQVALEE